MKRFNVFDGAFNITMVCNLTCDGCESFNNYNFKGHLKYADYAHYYKEWSKKISVDIVTIHGGEPFTNPDIVNWGVNLKQLWPTAEEYYVATNGTMLKIKSEAAKKLIELGYYLNVCVHDPAMYDDIRDQLEFVLQDYAYHMVPNDIGIQYIDFETNERLAILETTYHFKKSAIDYIKDKTWYMHRSNEEDAYDVCLENNNPCNFFHKGLLYQCQLTALKEDLFLQFSIEPEAVDLLKKYKHGDPFMSAKELKRFFGNHNKPIPQCTLCPGCNDTHPIYPMSKKKITF